MAIIPINTPDGKTLELNAPDGSSPDQIKQAAQAAVEHYKQQNQPQQPSGGIAQKAWDALTVPEKLSKQGLNTIAQSIPKNIGSPTGEPTGNMARDVIAGAPRIAADTVAEVAPGFISRGSLLTMGALQAAGAAAPAIKAVLRSAGNQAESLSGIAPKASGALEAAYQDAGTMFSKGKQAVGGLYKEALQGAESTPQGVLNKIQSPLAGLYKNDQIVDAASQALKDGSLSPEDAFRARKATDALRGSKQYSKDALQELRNAFDGLAKTNKGIAEADPAYQQAVRGEALRNILPQNKYGGASAFKLATAAGGEALAHSMGIPPGVATGITGMAYSPAVQGAIATGAGIAGRSIVSPLVNAAPQAQVALSGVLQSLNNVRKKYQR